MKGNPKLLYVFTVTQGISSSTSVMALGVKRLFPASACSLPFPFFLPPPPLLSCILPSSPFPSFLSFFLSSLLFFISKSKSLKISIYCYYYCHYYCVCACVMWVVRDTGISWHTFGGQREILTVGFLLLPFCESPGLNSCHQPCVTHLLLGPRIILESIMYMESTIHFLLPVSHSPLEILLNSLWLFTP